jgi:hypothetical protein
MAKGRTISATELTDKDKKGLEICQKISENLTRLIIDSGKREDFIKNYGRVHFSRDAGLGRAGGKLQRDALCTRGRTDKAPFSNRNLRWHPLIVAMETPSYAEEVEEITVDNRSLVFIIDGELWYPKDIHKLPKVYCAPYHKWYEIKDDLVRWNDEDWTNNSCVIPAMEHSTMEYSVEVFAVLGIAIVNNFYGVDINDALAGVKEAFREKDYTPTEEFPTGEKVQEIVLCPLCLAPLNAPPGDINLAEREDTFQPPWRKSKRKEGEAEALQLFHTYPLKESEILHTPKLVRYGHRWCNVAMADHSVEETVDFMKAVVEAHERKSKN